MSSTSRSVEKLSFGVEKILMMEATSNDSGELFKISSYFLYKLKCKFSNSLNKINTEKILFYK